MKILFKRLNKQEKKQALENFYKTDKGKELKVRLKRLNIIGILGIIYSFSLFLSDNSLINMITAIILIIFSTMFIIESYKIKIKSVNDFLVNKLK